MQEWFTGEIAGAAIALAIYGLAGFIFGKSARTLWIVIAASALYIAYLWFKP